jgi:hypothetical protein
MKSRNVAIFMRKSGLKENDTLKSEAEIKDQEKEQLEKENKEKEDKNEDEAQFESM